MRNGLGKFKKLELSLISTLIEFYYRDELVKRGKTYTFSFDFKIDDDDSILIDDQKIVPHDEQLGLFSAGDH